MFTGLAQKLFSFGTTLYRYMQTRKMYLCISLANSPQKSTYHFCYNFKNGKINFIPKLSLSSFLCLLNISTNFSLTLSRLGGGGGVHPRLYSFLRGFKYVALIIKNFCDFSQIYFVDTIPPLQKKKIYPSVQYWCRELVSRYRPFHKTLLDQVHLQTGSR